MSDELDTVQMTLEMLPDWEERYRYIIGLGEDLEPLEDSERCEVNKVRGCMSQVWLVTDGLNANGHLHFRGDSDAHIVRGLVAILLKIYADKTPQEIVDTDINAVFGELNLEQHVSMNRRNGLYSMVEKIQNLAKLQLQAS